MGMMKLFGLLVAGLCLAVPDPAAPVEDVSEPVVVVDTVIEDAISSILDAIIPDQAEESLGETEESFHETEVSPDEAVESVDEVEASLDQAEESLGQADEIPLPVKAEDITMTCAINGYEGPEGISVIRDGRYQTYYEGRKRDGIYTLTLAAPEGKTIGGILLKWKATPVAVDVQVPQGDDWVTVTSGAGDMAAEYIPIPSLKEFRILSRDDGGASQLEICEITIVTPGELPDDFQVWRKAPEKVDMMLIAGHPDDEVLWFGGLLPTYAGEQDKDVLVVNGTYCTYIRRQELLDCLWACGVDIYPVFMGYYDVVNWHLEQVYEKWGGKDAIVSHIVKLYRQYRPDVVVLHAVEGETGHGAHRVLSDAGRLAVSLAVDGGYRLDDESRNTPWQIKKVYVHLWDDYQIKMDWHVPLQRFGGLDSFEVASQAFEKHISQVNRGYHMTEGGDRDNSLFGLFYSVVGLDEAKDDMFEHIPAGE